MCVTVPVRAEQEIAGDEGHADGVARLERPVEGHLAGPRPGGAAPSARSPDRGTPRRACPRDPGSKPDITSGVAIGRSIVRDLAAAEAGDAAAPTNCASSGRSANGRFQFSALRNAATQVVARQRKLDLHARAGRPRRCRPRRVGHLVDRRDAGDRLLREAAERVGDRADQPSVDVDRAAAHAGDDAGLGERSAFEPRENQVALRCR